MLLALIIVAATVICSCAMFLHYLPSDADD
jgi:hypothetical protein